ncbi:MAG: GatB/YqeY domain-containing protein [Caldilineaceae bacterium]
MQIREKMKADLTRAMKARQPEAVDGLRAVLAAIDNAEAVPVEQAAWAEPVMGQRTEVPRKELSAEDTRQIIQREVDERRAASVKYASLGLADEAARLARVADLIAGYLGEGS